MAADLFGDERGEKKPDTFDRDSLDGRVTVFLNRWQWRGDRALVRAELLDLIAFAKARGGDE